MKNILKNINKSKTLLGVLFLFASIGYSQIRYTQDEQKAHLDIVAKKIWSVVPGRAQGANTIAIMQIPYTNTFVIGSNNTNQATEVINTRTRVIVWLQEEGFTVDKLIYIKGYGNNVTMEPMLDGDTSYPNIKAYACPLSERQTNVNTMLSIHAEMSILTFLAIYTNYNTNLLANDPQYIVMGVDKAYCARCFSYLYHINAYTMELNQFSSTTIKDPVNSQKYWSLPNYTRSQNSIIRSTYTDVQVVNPGPRFPQWHVDECANYVLEGILYKGIIGGSGIEIAPATWKRVPALPVYDYLEEVYGE